MLDESSPGRVPMPFRNSRIKRKVIDADRSGDAQRLKNADLNPGWIELVPQPAPKQ